MRRGTVLADRYEIEASIGHGGMGSVWRAFDVQLERVVAVKLLRPDLAGDEIKRQRFLREARQLAALRQPGIVGIYDFGEHVTADTGRLPYLVMDYVAGQSLRQKLQDGALPARLALPWLSEVAATLQAAHDAGVVHRDVKPANIVLSADGNPTVVDFGLALRPGDERFTTADHVMATPEYSAPESRADPSTAPTPAGDVYSLGVLITEVLTGRRHTTPQDVTASDALSPRVKDVVARALAIPPQRRISAGELAEVLRAAAAEAPPEVEVSQAIAAQATDSTAHGSARNGRWGRVSLAVAGTSLTAVIVAWSVAPQTPQGQLRDVGGTSEQTTEDRSSAKDDMPIPPEAGSGPEPYDPNAAHTQAMLVNSGLRDCMHGEPGGPGFVIKACDRAYDTGFWWVFDNGIHQNVGTGACLTAASNGMVRSTDSPQCDPEAEDQLWEWRDDELVSVAHQRCLDGGMAQGVSLRECGGNDEQSWEPSPVE